MVFEIEILTLRNKKIVNAYKKDQLGIEYGSADDLGSLEDAINFIRNRWKHNGLIRVVEDGNKRIIGE